MFSKYTRLKRIERVVPQERHYAIVVTREEGETRGREVTLEEAQRILEEHPDFIVIHVEA